MKLLSVEKVIQYENRAEVIQHDFVLIEVYQKHEYVKATWMSLVEQLYRDVMSAQQDGFVTFAETKVRYFLPMKTLVKPILLVVTLFIF